MLVVPPSMRFRGVHLHHSRPATHYQPLALNFLTLQAQNMVVLDRPTYDKILKEVPTFKMISQSTLIDRMKINGSLARVAIQHLEREGQIKRLIHHNGQLVYSEFRVGGWVSRSRKCCEVEGRKRIDCCLFL